MLATLAGTLVLLAQTPAPLDRSGEPLLKKAFAASGALLNGHLLLSRSNRTFGGIYLLDSTLDLWRGSANHIRMESMSTMGDSTVTVTDGTVTMVDPLSDDEPIRLSKASGNLEGLNSREPFLFFLSGASAFDRFVDTASPIKLLESGDAVEFRSKTLGKIVVKCSASGMPNRIELFQATRRRDAGIEMEYPVTVTTVQILDMTVPAKSLFSVVPPKGLKVQDDRPKP